MDSAGVVPSAVERMLTAYACVLQMESEVEGPCDPLVWAALVERVALFVSLEMLVCREAFSVL